MDGPNFNLAGRVALLTGAGRGIGLGMAQALAAHGAAVAIQDIEPAVARAEADRVNAAGGRAIALGGDMGDLAVVEGLVPQVVEQLGGLHVLVNNAAIQRNEHWLDVAPADAERQWRVNLTAVLVLCQRAAPIFKAQRWGRIINLSSIQARRPNPTMLPYSMSKAGIEHITTALARDLAADNVTVNAIAPGWVDTWRNRGDLDWARDNPDAFKKAVPLGRIGQPTDFGGVAVLLCSAAGDYITGQTIGIDGGMSAR